MELKKNDYLLSDNKELIDLNTVHELLKISYWADKRTKEQIKKSIEHSLVFGLYKNEQVGFARFVTDKSTYAWFCDFIIFPEHRGKGLGKWMLENMLKHTDIQNMFIQLGTKDAHELYKKYKFEKGEMMFLNN